ncbi:hypothetical protein PV419_04875 [Streptomyces sp. ME19-01-6]|nr:hypothetical protein [Streptomyces sp. ME19-01-6]MDX3225055.1 hypothetical protein [Streptomyces sp. ME19-01-6]
MTIGGGAVAAMVSTHPTLPTDGPRYTVPDVAALARGEYRQVYDGRATTAHVAFIDEILKCSTAATNCPVERIRPRSTLLHRAGRMTAGRGRSRPRRGRPRGDRSDNLRSIEDLTDVHAAADLFRVI